MASESEVLRQKGMVVRLGDEERTIKPHTIGKAQEWREKLAPILDKLLGDSGDISNPEDVKEAFVKSPMDMVKVVATYCGIEEQEILDKATEIEVVIAFNSVMAVAVLPFLAMQQFKKDAFDSKKRDELMRPSGRSTTSPSANGA